MENAMTKLLYVLLMSAFFLNLSGGEVLLDGTADVKLEITAPIEAEKTAETELKTYNKRIFAGHPGKSVSHARFILRHDPELGDQEFKIRCADNQVVISGGRPQGLLYGTYWFLDRKMGVHLYDAYAEYCPSKEKKEYPKVKLVIFAYIASQKPPENMKVDDNLATNWTPGLGVGWTMIDLGENRFINRITTVFHKMRFVKRATYQVEGSFDKKAWRTMIPKKTVTVPEKLQQTGNPGEIYCFDDVVLDKDVEARYIRTRIFKSENRRADGVYRGDDVQHT